MEAKIGTSPLLTSYKMGKFNLSHRVVLPPLTRNRAFNNKPQAHGVEYYTQRTTDGGFLISEAAAATDISLRCPNMPGIWTEKQVEAWKPIVEAVHAKGGIIFCQIWHPARISNYTFAPEGSDLIKPISKKAGGDYHRFDITSRGSLPSTEEEEGQGNIHLQNRADVAATDAGNAYNFGWADKEEKKSFLIADGTEAKAGISPHDYILFDREEAATSPLGSTNRDESVAPHAYILFDRENVATSPLGSTNKDESVAPHAYILFDREKVATSPLGSTSEDGSVAPHAYILFDREEVATSPFGSTTGDGSVAPHAYILFDREEAATSSLGSTSEVGSVAPQAYILFDREEAVTSSFGSTGEDGSVAPHAYILFDREETATSPLDSTREDGSIAPHSYLILDREDVVALSISTTNGDTSHAPQKFVFADMTDGAARPYILFDRNDPANTVPLLIADRDSATTTIHTVPLLIADRVSATTTNDRELDLDHKGIVLDKLSIEKSKSIVNDFALAARNAIKAGFDGVEINCAHGYLIERHLNDQVKNNTPDPYGGSIENRCSLALDVVQAVTNEIGSDRVGIKLSPFDDFHGSGNLSPITIGTYLATELDKLGLLYLHVTEPRMIKIGDEFKTPRSLQSIREAFEGTLIASGGYDKADGDAAVAEDYADLVSFGRLFVANPDLPKRFEMNAPLNKHDRSTFYVPEPVLGYTDYPSLEIVS